MQDSTSSMKSPTMHT